MANVHAEASSIGPLLDVISVLQLFCEDIYWTSKDLEVLERPGAFLIGKRFPGAAILAFLFHGIMDVDCLADCEGPEFFRDDIGPSMHGMQQHCSSPSSDGSDVSLDDTVLPVSAYATMGEVLLSLCYGFSKFRG